VTIVTSGRKSSLVVISPALSTIAKLGRFGYQASNESSGVRSQWKSTRGIHSILSINLCFKLMEDIAISKRRTALSMSSPRKRCDIDNAKRWAQHGAENELSDEQALQTGYGTKVL